MSSISTSTLESYRDSQSFVNVEREEIDDEETILDFEKVTLISFDTNYSLPYERHFRREKEPYFHKR
jgi:hypothetical protein